SAISATHSRARRDPAAARIGRRIVPFPGFLRRGTRRATETPRSRADRWRAWRSNPPSRDLGRPCHLRSFVPERDSASRQVIWRDRDSDSIADEHANLELAHLAGGRGEDFVPVVERHAEHGAREHLGYDAV